MYEQDYRKTLSREELEARGLIVPFKVLDFSILERLDKCSIEFEKTWDTLINTAIVKLLDDIELVKRLRK
jgi:hypothetical protein